MARNESLGTKEAFFSRLREGSRKKQKIVSDYFVFYHRVMTARHEKVGYADLFAGPGTYIDAGGIEHKSIPVLVTESTIREELFRQRVHLWFNEGDFERYLQLRSAIDSVPDISTLRFPPTVRNKVIDQSWVGKLRKLGIPTLVFLDPCGYKGLSLRLVASILEGYGNDCIFFFNYSRINMKLDLAIMNDSIDEFFEPGRAGELRAAIEDKGPDEREETILEAVRSAIKAARGIPLTFRFKGDSNRTSHHLVFATKLPRAAQQMKRIFDDASSTFVEGVGSGEHDPQASRMPGYLFGGLFEVEERLLSTYSGSELTFGELLLKETGIRFTDTHYRDAVLKLEENGRVIVDPPAEKRPFQRGRQKRTLSPEVRLKFISEVNRGD